ncbi:putative disease resistance protein RGA3 [Zingiber officinale]|uniref:putative disease resistance protein RGA3 n=1 Tax=Zingiber officinale TaxID=94328 RepID=UPI001C4B2296|nr:putative disease resistance protein RGA3 [Zingiber officinale]
MAVVLSFFVKRYIDKLSEFIEGEISKVLGVKEEIKRLHRKLSRISIYIQDAEKKRQKDPVIDNWVKELKDIMYDAEDILDLCLIEGGRLLEAHPSSSGVCSPVSLLSSCFQCSKFRRNICHQIKRVDERLDEIKEDNRVIPRLLEHRYEGLQETPVKKSISPTSPIHVAADIVGTQIVDAAEGLISEIEHSKKRCSVLGISGMGGIGKTILAQKIFNDEMVKKQFPNRVWLHVSKDYSHIELLKQVLRGVRGNDDGVQSRAEVEGRIVSLLSESLLLVLDDIWSASVWRDLLRNPILNGSCRTAILFTTRHEDVATDMRADFVHHVEKMDQDNGWELIRKIVFGDGEDQIISELKEVGMEIVRKCDGLPLAIKVIAGVLFRKERTKREWKNVIESDLWFMKENENEVSKALYLSYENLPCHLKQCFLSCAFYCAISIRSDIIRLWVAEGFVIERSNSLMEDIAEDYYKELIASNLLQMDNIFLTGTRFVMHDILRSFGENLMEEEGIIINNALYTNINSLTKIRRLSISSQGDLLLLPNAIIEQKCLRALHLVNCPQIKRIENHAFENLKRLRVLDLCDTSIDSLPDSLTKLLHLKYLGLDRTKIRRLPESIKCLANLQTLNLSGCESLHELPKGITRLINLRCLRIEDKLERATSTGSRNFVLANKAFLRRLNLGWTMNINEYSEEQITEAERIFNQLSPPPTLQGLRITVNFPGRQFPEWMVSTSGLDSLADLTFFNLVNFPSCTVLPPLGQLPNLKILHIEGGEAIKSIGPEFLGCRTPAFPKLMYVAFKNMTNWETWVLSETQDVVEPNEDVHARNLNSFPNLKECKIIHCPKLKNSILPSNRYLQINNCPNLEYVEKIGMFQYFRVVFPSEIQQLPQWASCLVNVTLHKFSMECNSLLLDSCSKGKQNWHIIQRIPKVTIDSIDRERRLLLNKDSYKYEIKDEFGSVEETCQTLRSYWIKLNPIKYLFGAKGGHFLGYIVTERGIEVNPGKVKALQDMSPPRNLKEVQRLTGKITALSRFISKSSDRSLPFFKILRRATKFQWDDGCDQAFKELKQYLSSLPILAKPIVGEPFWIYLSSIEYAIGSALVRQEGGIQ